MTIRFAPDGFSFAEGSDCEAALSEAPFNAIAPGPDFGHQLQEKVLDLVPIGEQLTNLTCQFISTRVILLPPDITDSSVAEEMYHLTINRADADEQLLLQPVELKGGQTITLCFGIDRDLFLFLQRNYGELTFEHRLASLITEGSRKSSGTCLVVRCDSQTLELVLFRNNQVEMANVYHATQVDTRCYYVMNTWLQMGLDQLEDNLLVVSTGTEGLQIRASLHRFIKHVFS